MRERNDRESWTALHELLAQLVEQVSVLRIEAFLVAGVPRWKLPQPHRVPRPGDAEEAETVVTPSEFARLSVVN